MENIKFSVFDIFAYLLPGAVGLGAVVLFSTPQISNIAQYIDMTKDISASLAVIIVVVSYVFGNVLDNLGSFLYYKIGCKIWGSPYPKYKHPTLTHTQQRSLIRMYSIENFNVLQSWKVLKTMSHNLSFALLLLFLAAMYHFLQNSNFQWVLLSVISIVSSVVLLNRANIYDKWHYKEMLEMIDVLRQEKKIIVSDSQ